MKTDKLSMVKRDVDDELLIEEFRRLRKQGVPYLLIYSRRQDIGIMKCERGVQLGWLIRQELQIDEQETHWRYYFTDEE